MPLFYLPSPYFYQSVHRYANTPMYVYNLPTHAILFASCNDVFGRLIFVFVFFSAVANNNNMMCWCVGPVAMKIGNITHIIQFYKRTNQMYQLNEGRHYKTLLVVNFKTNIILFTRLT